MALPKLCSNAAFVLLIGTVLLGNNGASAILSGSLGKLVDNVIGGLKNATGNYTDKYANYTSGNATKIWDALDGWDMTKIGNMTGDRDMSKPDGFLGGLMDALKYLNVSFLDDAGSNSTNSSMDRRLWEEAMREWRDHEKTGRELNATLIGEMMARFPDKIMGLLEKHGEKLMEDFQKAEEAQRLLDMWDPEKVAMKDRADRMGYLRMLLCDVIDVVRNVVGNLDGVSKIFGMFSLDAFDPDAAYGIGRYYFDQIMGLVSEGPPELGILKMASDSDSSWENLGEKIIHVYYTLIHSDDMYQQLAEIFEAFGRFPEARHLMNKLNDAMMVVGAVADAMADFGRGNVFAPIDLDNTVQLKKLMKLTEIAPELFEVIARTATTPERIAPLIQKVIEDPIAVCLDPRIVERYMVMGHSRLPVADIVGMMCKVDYQELMEELGGSKSKISMALELLFSEHSFSEFDAHLYAYNAEMTVRAVGKAVEDMTMMFQMMSVGMWPNPEYVGKLVDGDVWGQVFHNLGRHFESFANKSIEDYMKAIPPVVQLVLGGMTQQDAQMFVRLDEGMKFLGHLFTIVKGFPDPGKMFEGADEVQKLASLLDYAPEVVEQLIHLVLDAEKVPAVIMQLAEGVDICGVPQLQNMSAVIFVCQHVDRNALMDELMGKNGLFAPLMNMFSEDFYGFFEAEKFGVSMGTTVLNAMSTVETMSATIEGMFEGKVPMPRWMNGTLWEGVFGRVAGTFMSMIPSDLSNIGAMLDTYLPGFEGIFTMMGPDGHITASMINDGLHFGIGVMRFMQNMIDELNFNGTMELRKIAEKMDELPEMLEDFLYKMDSTKKIVPVVVQVFSGANLCEIPPLVNTTIMNYFCTEVNLDHLMVDLAMHPMTAPLIKLIAGNHSTQASFDVSQLSASIKAFISENMKTQAMFPLVIAEIMNATEPLPGVLQAQNWMVSFGRLGAHFENVNVSIIEEIVGAVPLVQVVTGMMDEEFRDLVARLGHGASFLSEVFKIMSDLPAFMEFKGWPQMSNASRTLDMLPEMAEEIYLMVMDPALISNTIHGFMNETPICAIPAVQNSTLGRFVCNEFNMAEVLNEVIIGFAPIYMPFKMMFDENPVQLDDQLFVQSVQNAVREGAMMAENLPMYFGGLAAGAVEPPRWASPKAWGAMIQRQELQGRQYEMEMVMSVLTSFPKTLQPLVNNVSADAGQLLARVEQGAIFVTNLLNEPDLESAFNLTNATWLDSLLDEFRNPYTTLRDVIESVFKEPESLLDPILSGTPLCDLPALTSFCGLDVGSMMQELESQPTKLSRPLENLMNPNFTGDFNSTRFMDNLGEMVMAMIETAQREPTNGTKSDWPEMLGDVVKESLESEGNMLIEEYIKAALPILKWQPIVNLTSDVLSMVGGLYHQALGIYDMAMGYVEMSGLCSNCPMAGLALERHGGRWYLGDHPWDNNWGHIYKKDGEYWIGAYKWHEFFKTHRRFNDVWKQGNWTADETLERCVKHVEIALEGCIDYDEVRSWRSAPDRHMPPTGMNGTWAVYGMDWGTYREIVNYYNHLLKGRLTPDGKNFTAMPKMMKDGSVHIGNSSWASWVDGMIQKILATEGKEEMAEHDCASWYPWLKDREFTEGGCLKFDQIADVLNKSEHAEEPKYVNGSWYAYGRPWEMLRDDFEFYFDLLSNFTGNKTILERPRLDANGSVKVGDHTWKDYAEGVLNRVMGARGTPLADAVDCKKWKEGDWQCVDGGFQKGDIKGIAPYYANGTMWLADEPWNEKWGKWEKKYGTWHVQELPWFEFFSSHKLLRGKWVRGMSMEGSWMDCIDPSIDMFPLEDCINTEYLGKFVHSAVGDKGLRFDGMKWMFLGMDIEVHAMLFHHMNDVLNSSPGLKGIQGFNTKFKPTNSSVMMDSSNKTLEDYFHGVAYEIMEMIYSSPAGQAVDCANRDFLKDVEWECRDGMFFRGPEMAMPRFEYGQFWLNEDPLGMEPWEYRDDKREWFVDGVVWHEYFRNMKNGTWLDCLDGKMLDEMRPQKCANFSNVLHALNKTNLQPPVFANGTWWVSKGNLTWKRFVTFYQDIQTKVPQLPPIGKEDPFPGNTTVFIGSQTWDMFVNSVVKPAIRFASSQEAKEFSCDDADPNAGYHWECKDGKFWKGTEMGKPEYRHGSWWINEDMWAWDPFEFRPEEDKWYVGGEEWHSYFSSRKYVDGNWEMGGKYSRNETWVECIAEALMETKPRDENCVDFQDILFKFDMTPPEFKEGKWRTDSGMVWDEMKESLMHVNRILSLDMEDLIGGLPRYVNDTVKLGNFTYEEIAEMFLSAIRDASMSQSSREKDCKNVDPNAGIDWACKNGKFYRGDVMGKMEYRHMNWWINNDSWIWEPIHYRPDEESWFVGDLHWKEFFSRHRLVNGMWQYDDKLPRNESWFECVKEKFNHTKPEAEDCVDFDEVLRNFDMKPPEYKEGKWWAQGMSWDEFAAKIRKFDSVLRLGLSGLDRPPRVWNETLLIGNHTWDDFAYMVFTGIQAASEKISGAMLECSNKDPNQDLMWECKNGEFHKGTLRAKPEFRHGSWWLGPDEWAWDQWEFIERVQNWYIRDVPFTEFFRTHKLIDNDWVKGSYPLMETWLPCLDVDAIKATRALDCLNVDELGEIIRLMQQPPTFKNGTWWLSSTLPWNEFTKMVGFIGRFVGIDVNIVDKPRIVNETLMVGDFPWSAISQFMTKQITELTDGYDIAFYDCSNQDPDKDLKWECKDGEWHKGDDRAKPIFEYGDWWIGDALLVDVIGEHMEWNGQEWQIRGMNLKDLFSSYFFDGTSLQPCFPCRSIETSMFQCLDGPWLDDFARPKTCLDLTELTELFKDEQVPKMEFKNGKWLVNGRPWSEVVALLRGLFAYFDQPLVEDIRIHVDKNGTLMIGQHPWEGVYIYLKEEITHFASGLAGQVASCDNSDELEGVDWQCKDGQFRKGNISTVPEFRHGTWWLGNDMWAWDPMYMQGEEWMIMDMPIEVFFATHKLVNGHWKPGKFARNETWADCIMGPWFDIAPSRPCVDLSELGDLVLQLSSINDAPVFAKGSWSVDGMPWSEIQAILSNVQQFINFDGYASRFRDAIRVVNGSAFIRDMPLDKFLEETAHNISKFTGSLEEAVADCRNQGPGELKCKDGKYRMGNMTGEVTYEFGTIWVLGHYWRPEWGFVHFMEGQWFVNDIPFEEFFLTHMINENSQWELRDFPRSESYLDCVSGPWMNNSDTIVCLDVEMIGSMFDPAKADVAPVYIDGQWVHDGVTFERLQGVLELVQALIPIVKSMPLNRDMHVKDGKVLVGSRPWQEVYRKVATQIHSLDPNNPDLYAANCANFNPSENAQWSCQNGQFIKGEITTIPEYRFWNWWLLDDPWQPHWPQWRFKQSWFIGDQPWDDFLQTHAYKDGEWIPLTSGAQVDGESWFECFDPALLVAAEPLARVCIEYDVMRAINEEPDLYTPVFANGSWSIGGMSSDEFKYFMNNTLLLLPPNAVPRGLNVMEMVLRMDSSGNVWVSEEMRWDGIFKTVMKTIVKFDNTFFGETLSCSFNGSVDAGAIPTDNCPRDCTNECFGTAEIDDCGMCTGGRSPFVFNQLQDCMGVCRGRAFLDDECDICLGGTSNYTSFLDITDCDGTCVNKGGNKVFDCWGDCGGTATINECDECVGGKTGRAQNFGIDQCGVCTSRKRYFESWDCNGDCNGNATWDWCAETCVGGLTGYAENHFDHLFDCVGVCNGTFTTDSCGHCTIVDKKRAPYGSIFMDCASTCHSPLVRNRRNWALNNTFTCDTCAGGETGVPLDHYRDTCGICFGDNSTCLDCAGVPFGGKTIDACKVCGGDGSSCTALRMVEPRFIEQDTMRPYILEGAGFTEQPDCVFTPSNGGSAITEAAGFFNLTHIRCFAELPKGTYTVSVVKGGVTFSATDADLGTVEAYDPSEITVTSMTPSEFVLPKAGFAQGQKLNITLRGQLLPTTGCIATGPGIPPMFIAAAAGSTSNELTCTVDLSVIGKRSLQAFIYPTFDGVIPMGNGQAFTLWREGPILLSVKFANSGSSLKAVFDETVDLSFSCYELFANSAVLGEGAVCFQTSMKKLKIFLGRRTTVTVGTQLTLKNDTVTSLFEIYGRPAYGSVAVSAPNTITPPKAKISGSSFISYCDDVYLSGRRSSGGGGRALNYFWSVSSQFGSNVAEIQDGLNTQNGSAFMYVNGSLLTQGDTYTFTLSVSMFMNPNTLVSTTHDMVRESVVKPRVQIDARANVDRLKTSSKFLMAASVKLSSCAQLAQLTYQWSSPTAGVKINVDTRTKRFYFVKANDLPAGKTITFQVEVAMASQPNIKSTSTITLTTLSSPLVALVKGGYFRTVGRASGNVTFDGSISEDPDNEAIPMTYVWTCKEMSTGGSCLSMKEGENAQAFPTNAEKTNAVLTFDALRFSEDESYEFTLTVTKQTRSSTATVIAFVVAGEPPKVAFGSSAAAGSVTVKPGEVVTLQVDITSKTEVLPSGVVWESQQLDGYGYVNLTDDSKIEAPGVITQRNGNSDDYISIIRIKGSALSQGSLYKIVATVNNVEGKGGNVTAEVIVRGGVTSCIFQATNYTILDTVTLETNNCFATEDALPITYKYGYVDENGEFKTSGSKGIESAVDLIGSTPPTGNTLTRFVEVCDGYDVCNTLVSDPVYASPASISAEDVAAVKTQQVDAPASIGDYTTAMINTNNLDAVLDSVGLTLSRRRRSTAHSRHKRDVAPTNSSATTTQLLTLVDSFIKESTLSREDVFIVLEQVENIQIVETNAADQTTLLNYLDTLVSYLAGQNGLDKAHAQIVLDKLNDLLAYPANSQFVIADIEAKCMKAMTFDLTFGGSMQEVKAKTNPRVTVSSRYNTLASVFSSKGSENASSVDFGSELAGSYMNWACGGSSNCLGAVAKFRHYETEIDDKSSLANDKDNRASDLVEITLANPYSGDDLVVQNLTTPIKINMTVTKPKSNSVYGCYFWDDSTNAWSTSGMTSVGTDGDVVMCESTHLSIFVVIASEAPSTTAAPTTTGVPPNTTTGDSVTTTAGGSGQTTAQSAATTTSNNNNNNNPTTTQGVSAPAAPVDVALIAGVAAGGAVLLVVIVIVAVVLGKRGCTANKVGNSDGDFATARATSVRPRNDEMERADTPSRDELYGGGRQATEDV